MRTFRISKFEIRIALTAMFVVALALVLFATSLAADAQQAARIPRVAWLRPGSAPDPMLEAFRQGLRDLDYIEGKNIAIEPRWAEGKSDRLPPLAAELVRLGVDVIVTNTMPAILAAQEATSTIPIVTVSADPVGTGLANTLARPGGNITGLSILGPKLEGKRLELLKAALPSVIRVGFLWNPANTASQLRFREAQAAAKALGIKLQSVEVRQPDELPKAFAAMTKERVGAVLVPSAFAGLHKLQIAEISTRNRLPVMYDSRDLMDAEGLMSYGPDVPDLYRRAASYVDKILKGAKPADLPIEQPTKFDLVINLKKAKALGLSIPKSLLSRADEVIQ